MSGVLRRGPRRSGVRRRRRTHMPGRLEGKVAFIPGGGRGQGRSHAVRFAEEGADIIGIDICADVPNMPYSMSSRADLDETIAMVEKFDRRMVAHVADCVGNRPRSSPRGVSAGSATPAPLGRP